MSIHSCIACDKKRISGSGFCKQHKLEHSQSPYVKRFHELLLEIAVEKKKGKK